MCFPKEQSFQVLDGLAFFLGWQCLLRGCCFGQSLFLAPGAMVAFGAERQDLSAGSLQAIGANQHRR